MGTAVGVISTGVGMLGQQKAGQAAAAGQVAAAEANIAFLEQSGQEGAADIARRELEAIKASERALTGIEPIQRFADIGTQGFQTAQQRILSGDAGSPISRAVAAGGVRAAEALSPSTGPVRRAIIRRARLGGESLEPQFNQALLGFGQQAGLGGVSDISGIQLRQAETAGDIALQSGAGQASALIGQAPQVAQAIQSGQEGRALGQAAQAQFQTGAAENIAALIGRNV